MTHEQRVAEQLCVLHVVLFQCATSMVEQKTAADLWPDEVYSRLLHKLGWLFTSNAASRRTLMTHEQRVAECYTSSLSRPQRATSITVVEPEAGTRVGPDISEV